MGTPTSTPTTPLIRLVHPQAFADAVRFEAARDLLQNTDLQISEISRSICFDIIARPSGA